MEHKLPTLFSLSTSQRRIDSEVLRAGEEVGRIGALIVGHSGWGQSWACRKKGGYSVMFGSR